MMQEIPKQFININGKPVITYTLNAFERHPDIDEIGVVCRSGWEEILKAFAEQAGIKKLKWIVPGGKNGQDSIRAGVEEAECRYNDEDIILVHDAVRPMVGSDIISDCIVQCRRHGSAITVVPETTVMLKKTTSEYSKEVVDRATLARTQTPQAFPLRKLAWAHREAKARGITNSTASCTLFIELGEKVYFSIGSETNIKLTTQGDMQIFKALLALQNSEFAVEPFGRNSING